MSQRPAAKTSRIQLTEQIPRTRMHAYNVNQGTYDFYREFSLAQTRRAKPAAEHPPQNSRPSANDPLKLCPQP